MTINSFLLLVLFLMAAILVVFYRTSKVSRSPIPYFVVLALAMLASYYTFTHYAKSHGGYYKNTDYHIIQQDGFKYPKGQTLMLTSDAQLEKAFLATGLGELKLDGEGRLQSTGFRLPLYVEDKNHPLNFQVVNVVDELSMESGDQLEIWLNRRSDTVKMLSIKYEEIRNNDKIAKYRFSFSVDNKETDSVDMPSFRQGYNLVDLLQKGKSTRLDVNRQLLLANCYLLRKSYELDVTNPEMASGKVCLFGMGQLGDAVSVYKNGTQVMTDLSGNVENVPMDGRQFFYGLGATRSQVYKVSTNTKDVVVTYRLPKMYHFPAKDIKTGEAKLFLTTDKQEIIDRRGAYDCFYQFADQNAFNSIYKASAAMNFMIDSAGVALNPWYGDVNDDFNQTRLDSITIGEPFEVKTLSCGFDDGSAQVSHLFSIRDMRKNVVYNNAPNLYGWMMFLLLLIYVVLHLLKDRNANRMNKFYIVETSVYLTLIAFLTVRLVMLWRLYTFPPIENVTRYEMDRLTDPDNYQWTFIAIVSVLGLRIGVLLLQWGLRARTNGINEWVGQLFDKMDSITIPFKRNYVEMSLKWIVVLVLPFIVYWLCFVFSKIPGFEVVTKEAVAPIMAFVVNSSYYVYRVRVEPNNRNEFRRRGLFCWCAIIWNMLVFLFFLWKIFHENGMALPMIGVFAAWLFIIIFITPVSRERFKWVLPIVAAAFLIIVFWHVPLAQTGPGKKLVSKIPDDRIKARVVATSMTPSEMVQSESVEFGEKLMQDIRNASSNKWFIDSHLAQRYYLAKNKGNFILDKEFNQMAVKFITQTRDVVLLRYLIYEHGAGVVKKLLCILLLLTFNVFAMYKRKGRGLSFLQQLPMQTSLFLLMFSSYLYLVNLNAVVFVGLDFPFLTLISRVAPLGLLLPLLAILLPMNIKRLDESLVGSTDGNSKPDTQKAIVGAVSALMMVGFVMLPSLRMQQQIKKNNGQSTASFSVSMEPLAEFINEYMNPKFKEYQDQAPKKYEKMSVYNADLKAELRGFVFGSKNGKTPTIYEQLNKYVANTGRKNDTAFIRSAFIKLFNTPLTNTSNIISIRKQSGRFVFVTNKVYYDMKPMFKNNSLLQWHGDLLAAAGVSRLTFMGENRKETIELKPGFYVYGSRNDTKNVEKLKEEFLGVNDAKIINFNIVQIPKEYCYQPDLGGHDVFVLDPVDAKISKDYVIYPLGDATNPIKESNTAMWIKPNDIVKVSGQKQSFSFKTESGHYFSKRIHYNGKYQVIYPLEERFMFAYNFDQMLAETFHPKDSANQPIRISLDYQLLNDVYDYCETEMGRKKAYGKGVTVTAVDGNGRIRLLADYNPCNDGLIDPNNANELRRKMEDIYLNGNRKEERAMLQNRNVARMAVGPGSTIKVPFYVAIASKTHLDWTKIGVNFPDNSAVFKNGVVTKYGNYETEGIHKKGGWDELSGEYRPNGETMSTSRFVATSNNYFFGSIIGLSIYSSSALSNGLGGVLAQAQSNEAVFPKFKMNDRYYKFKNNFMNDFVDDARVLESGLEDNFGFPRYQNTDYGSQSFDVSPTDRIYINDTSASHASKMRSMNSEYVYSEMPNVHRYVQRTTPKEAVLEILHLTSGGARHLDVSPLKMTEMYLRIATLNNADNILTYSDDANVAPFSPFVSVNDNFASQMQQTAFLGMWNIFTDGSGTLRNGTDRNQRDKLSNQASPIYLYGKTGTVGAETQKNDNKHYAFILSNKRLDQTTDRTGLKVYVVYFGYYDTALGSGHSVTAETRKAILEKIIASETFQNYWNEETPNTTH